MYQRSEPMKLLRILAVVVLCLTISATVASGQTWQPLTNQPTFNPGVMLLLTDGTVIMHSEPNCLTCTTTDYSSWYKLTPDINDEEGWTLLPNGKVLTVDAYVFQYDATGTNSEIYNPSSATWTSAGGTIMQLWDSCGGADLASYEVGPAVLRPDGTVFATGANTCGPGHTAIYNSHSGTWTAGTDFPGA